MSASETILARIRGGQAVLLSADASSSLRAEGVKLHGSAALGRLVRERPGEVREHYQREVTAGVEVVCALTAETMPRALAQAGMAFRAAALTGTAVEMAMDVVSHAPRPIAVAGLLGGRTGAALAADRVAEECAMHAARLSAAGCEIIIACSVGPFASKLGRMSAIISASTLRLPTWALVEVHAGRTSDGEDLAECAKSAVDSGAQVLLLDAATEREAADAIEAIVGVLGEAKAGVMLADPVADPDAWAEAAKRLVVGGAHVLGGGPGTTTAHIAALARALHGPRSASIRPEMPSD
ncbi:MAG: homocysteine S-methyltransferase family protein [Polyangiaceae bacterium]